MPNPNYYKNCGTIAKHDDDALNKFLACRENFTHNEYHLCADCDWELSTGADGLCDRCRVKGEI